MDREPEELQYLGFFGVYVESFKLLYTWRRIFSQIASSLVAPLSLLYFTNIAISTSLFSKIHRNNEALNNVPTNGPAGDQILHHLASEWLTVFIFNAFYFIFLIIFSLLSTSAVVYSVAAVYTGRDLTIRKILAVVPKVWRRLMITFLVNFLILFAYNMVAIIFIILLVLVLGTGTLAMIAVAISLLLYIAGVIYITVIWHLASVISVLEDDCGIAAMRKGRALIRGKLVLAIAIFVTLSLSLSLLQLLFRRLVVEGYRLWIGAVARLGYGLLLLVLQTASILLGLVVQTVIYFVCKAYHHESIDKSSLGDHLDVYVGEYALLKDKDLQLEKFDL